MLRSLTLTNWKSFGETRNVIPCAPLTLLVGPNASGKSNALDALRFLQGAAALNFPLGDVLRGRWEGQREIWPPIRGHAVEAARAGRSEFALCTTWERGETLEHFVRIDVAGDVTLLEEHLLKPPPFYAFDTEAAALRGGAGPTTGGGINVALRARGKGNSVKATYPATRSLLGQIELKDRVAREAVDDARTLQHLFEEVLFLDIQPARMRDYKPEHAGVLGTSGENVSPVLARLHQRDPEKLLDLRDWLAELCAPTISDFGFDHTQLKEVMFFLVEGGGRRISARSVSDGTLRFLGLVTALLTAPCGSLVVIEEPDVGLHPSRVHLLAQLLEHVTRLGGIQVIATTHSPTLLAHLTKETLGNVVALERMAEGGETICTRLGDLKHFGTLRDSAQLDHLVSTGWIERAV